jgi:hypothetical protein
MEMNLSYLVGLWLFWIYHFVDSILKMQQWAYFLVKLSFLTSESYFLNLIYSSTWFFEQFPSFDCVSLANTTICYKRWRIIFDNIFSNVTLFFNCQSTNYRFVLFSGKREETQKVVSAFTSLDEELICE